MAQVIQTVTQQIVILTILLCYTYYIILDIEVNKFSVDELGPK